MNTRATSTDPERSDAEPFKDPDLSIEARIDDLLSRMTLDEKVSCLSTDPSVPRLGVRGSRHVEGLHGLALGGPGRWGRDRPVPTTTFPQAIGLAETWDPEAVREVAAVEATEARYAFQSPRYGCGGIVVRAPNADLGRDPRWGRTEECYGEDVYLTATMAVAFVRGLQGDDPRYFKTAALLKHFLANSNEDEREYSSSDFDAALFREYYARTFQRAIEQGGSRAFMAAYNRYNGIPCTVHPMLEEITVAEWGQDGIICTDGGAFRLLLTAHRYFPNLAEAAAACIKAGINQFLDDYREGVEGALEQKLVSEADLDRVLRGVFRVMIRLGLLDPPERVPYAAIGADAAEPEPWLSEAHRAAVRRVTQKSIVLLKNTSGLLPLALTGRFDRVRSIAVLGRLADEVHLDWYSGTPPYLVTPLEGIRKRVGPNFEVRHVSNNDTSEVLRVARTSDVCIVCVGNHPTGDADWAKVTRPSYGKEAVDRQSLTLEDEAFVRRVFEANPRTVLVLISSFPYAISWCKDHVYGIVHVTHNSQELGNALADVLFGDYNPAGRLVQTWPRSLAELPPKLDYDLRKGRTYLYSEVEPLYPFGYGLSYTTFTYTRIRTSAPTLSSAGPVTISVDVANTGKMAGDEVVQLYVRYRSSKVRRPLKELKAFQRQHIEAGETKTFELELVHSELAHWDEGSSSFVVEPGEVEVLIGRSSADIVLKTSVVVV